MKDKMLNQTECEFLFDTLSAFLASPQDNLSKDKDIRNDFRNQYGFAFTKKFGDCPNKDPQHNWEEIRNRSKQNFAEHGEKPPCLSGCHPYTSPFKPK